MELALAESGQTAAAAERLPQAQFLKRGSLPVALKLAEVTRDVALAQDLARRYPNEATPFCLVGRASTRAAALTVYRRPRAFSPLGSGPIRATTTAVVDALGHSFYASLQMKVATAVRRVRRASSWTGALPI